MLDLGQQSWFDVMAVAFFNAAPPHTVSVLAAFKTPATPNKTFAYSHLALLFAVL